MAQTVNHLYGDLALFSADEIVKDKTDELAFLSETKEVIKLREVIKDMHIVDKLNYVNSLKNIDKEDKSSVLRDIVQELKDWLPQTLCEQTVSQQPDPKMSDVSK